MLGLILCGCVHVCGFIQSKYIFTILSLRAGSRMLSVLILCEYRKTGIAMHFSSLVSILVVFAKYPPLLCTVKF